ncbi:hypothetical protein AVEN_180318-1 [Araneus ventricosus]|uniref:DUF4817 domain-containing protein n=1 Tax=Araneus ventricosus TaxID=182803 RepID=A0A4Y2LPN4_ARAVE|nr:hypothetical protein AVEN_180318-1 [Araneus ventricosus]
MATVKQKARLWFHENKPIVTVQRINRLEHRDCQSPSKNFIKHRATVAWPQALDFGDGGPQIPPKIRRVLGLLHAKSYLGAKRPASCVARKLGEWVPTQAPSSSSNRGSKIAFVLLQNGTLIYN